MKKPWKDHQLLVVCVRHNLIEKIYKFVVYGWRFYYVQQIKTMF
jgi:hypothetical protein